MANEWQSDNMIHKNIKNSKMKATDIAEGVVYMLSTSPHVLVSCFQVEIMLSVSK